MINALASGSWEAMDCARQGAHDRRRRGAGQGSFKVEDAFWLPTCDDAMGMWPKPRRGWLIGRGNTTQYKLIRDGTVKFPGKGKDLAHYLGPNLAANQSYKQELDARKEALHKAYTQNRGFWHKSGVPFQSEKALFISKVLNTAINCMECLLPNKIKHRGWRGL